MNQAENENINRLETLPQRESAETQSSAEFNSEMEGLFNNYKKDKVKSVDMQTAEVFQSGHKRLENASTIGYSPEELARLKTEKGVGARLSKNQQAIERLGSDTKRKIESVTSGESAEAGEQRERIMEQFQEKRGNMLTNFMTSEMASNGLDLVPFAGSGKMIVESISGKTLSGRKLSGKERIIHGAIGAGSLALDFTGIGEVKDVALIAGKSVGLVEKLGVKLAERGALKSAKVFEVTSKFMAEHPQLVAQAETFAEAKIKEGIKSIKDYRKQEA
jgi:hypothetical protein